REAETALGADSAVTANLRMAREAAEQNRVRFEGVAAQQAENAGTAQGRSLHPSTEALGDAGGSLLDTHLSGMPEPDRAAWRAALRSENGRGAEFQAADARLRAMHQAVESAFERADDDETYLLAATRYQEAWQEANRLLERV